MANSKKKFVDESGIVDILSKAASDPENPDVYANHVQLAVTTGEIILEFYYLHPTNLVGNMKVSATLKQRVIVPHGLGKAIVTTLANTIAIYEKDNNEVLPNVRKKMDDDTIEIWP